MKNLLVLIYKVRGEPAQMRNFYLTIKKNNYLILVGLIYIFFISYWIVIHLLRLEYLYETFSDTYGVVAFLSGIYGLKLSKSWGYTKSLVGKSIFLFALGLIAQGFGQITYSFYYLVLGVEVPYPSIGDLGYFGSIPLYAFGIWFLGRASGMLHTLKSCKGVLISVFVPLVLLIASYAFFLSGYEISETPLLVIFFDFGYPLGQAIYLSLAVTVYLLSRRVLGGIMKDRVLILLSALLAQYAADFTFLFRANREIWVAGGINDFMYLIAYALMFLALVYVESALEQIFSVNKKV